MKALKRLLVLFAGVCLAASVAAPALFTNGQAMAQSDPCSSTGGYPEGSPGAVLAGLRGLSSGEYAACVERRRSARPPVERSPAEVGATAREAVLAKLREPSSAVFRSVRRARQANGTTTFCGEVSASNAYGGRADFIRFQAAVTNRSETSVQFDSSDLAAKTHFDIGWRRYCAGGAATSF